MKLVTTKRETRDVKHYEGLVNVDVKHEIKQSTGSAEWLGPKIPPEEWQKILSFFKWTYDTTKSESQVRLYVNATTGTWRAWAMPQKAGMGMTAQEIACKEADEQRAQFPDSEGWIYFGTVHHHCSASAFQSGTDQANEHHQDGLHITVGNMSDPKHTMDARFYVNGYKFDPDMSEFWNIGDDLLVMLPGDVWDRIARFQMTTPSVVEFPEQWKTNLVKLETPQAKYEYIYTGPGSSKSAPAWSPGNGTGGGPAKDYFFRGETATKTPWRREIDTVEEFLQELALIGGTEEDAEEFIKGLDDSQIWDELIRSCKTNGTDPAEIVTDWNRIIGVISTETEDKAQMEKDLADALKKDVSDALQKDVDTQRSQTQNIQDADWHGMAGMD